MCFIRLQSYCRYAWADCIKSVATSVVGLQLLKSFNVRETMERLSVCIADHTRQEAFTAGSIINGNVILRLDKAKKIDRVNISFVGRSYIFVSEYEQELMKEKCSHADSDQELIIDLSTILWDGCVQPSSLEAGTHRFPFSIQLPKSLPSSFKMNSKDMHGCHIIYTFKANVSRPKKNSYRAELPVTIRNELNINDPSFACMQCVSGKKQKSGFHRYLPTNAGHVMMEVTTDHVGYCVGDSIAISVDITNSTKGNVSSLQAALIRSIMHKDHYHNNYRSVVEKVKNYSNQANMYLRVPQTSATITNCNTIKVMYKLKVKLKMTNGIKVVAFLPITIGDAKLDEYEHERSQFAEMTECQSSISSSIETLSYDSSSDCLNLL